MKFARASLSLGIALMALAAGWTAATLLNTPPATAGAPPPMPSPTPPPRQQPAAVPSPAHTVTRTETLPGGTVTEILDAVTGQQTQTVAGPTVTEKHTTTVTETATEVVSIPVAPPPPVTIVVTTTVYTPGWP